MTVRHSLDLFTKFPHTLFTKLADAYLAAISTQDNIRWMNMFLRLLEVVLLITSLQIALKKQTSFFHTQNAALQRHMQCHVLVITCARKLKTRQATTESEHNTYLSRVTSSSWLFSRRWIMLMFKPQFAFQPEEQLPLHMACSRPSGAVEIVKTLLKASGKDAKLTSDKVSERIDVLVNMCRVSGIFIEALETFPICLIQSKTRAKTHACSEIFTPEGGDVTLPSNVTDCSETDGILQRMLVPLHTSPRC